MDDPADIPRPQRPQAHFPVRRLAVPERHADIAHRLDDAIAGSGVDRLEQGVDLAPGGGLGCREDFSPSVGERQQPMFAVIGADLAAR